MYSRSLAIALVTVLSWAYLPSIASAAEDTPEAGSVEEIAKATTDAHYLSPWVSYLPASATIPSPRVFFHRIPGAPGELVNSEQTYAYFKALAAASPRVRLFTIGKSEEGRDIMMLATRAIPTPHRRRP
jgi:hypothetical protein